MIKIKKNGKKTWITFTFSPSYDVENVMLSGSWSNWKEELMKKKKNGDYYLTKVLPSENSFEFGYKINNNEWITEEECSLTSSPFNSQNSLINT